MILDKIKKDNELNENIQLEIINQSNKGFSGARNTGLKCLKGRYIMLLDSDDIIPENTIKTMMLITMILKQGEYHMHLVWG